LAFFSTLLSLYPVVPVSAQTLAPAIEDNSFLIEEAYNQNTRVVQHIFNISRVQGTRNALFTFTQEWPIGAQVHQLSYTIPYQSLETGKGLGDVLLNYRYQLFGENDPVWCAPRLSFSFPTGSQSKDLGSGVMGLQLSLPLSKRWSNDFVSHFDFGVSSFFQARGTDTKGNAEKSNLTSYSIGVSGIYLLAETFNLMCEVVHNENAAFGSSGRTVYSSQTIVSPGFRFAFNLPNLQIVPGFAVPVYFTSTSTEVGAFGYLSFEHPF
jgi:hypothetical protein